MRKIKIITDSTCDLNDQELQKYDIEVVPLLVSFGSQTYQDRIEINTRQLYSLVDQVGELPKTAARNPGYFMNIFSKYINDGYDVLCILISSELSSTYQSAHIASLEFDEDRIRVVDSRNLSTGIGLVLLKAVKYREEGKSLLEIDELLRTKIIPNVRSQFVVESLTYLHKGGRCSSTAHFFGQMLHIHPQIVVRNGKMSVYSKPRGKMIKAYNELLEMVKNDLDKIDLDTVMITHSIAPVGEHYLYQELSKLVPKESIMITEAGCVISSHCGKGTIGILYILKD
jgi:DegV family protein with EDD domain